MNIEIIGLTAGLLTTGCFIPQSIKALRAENTRSISLLMYGLFSLGVLLWLIYGIFLNNRPMIITNALTLPLSLVILGKKIHNIRKGID